MIFLARHYGQGPIFLSQVAEAEEISEKYLSQIIIPLRGLGLVNSTRGAHGGYALAKAPSDIRLLDIFKVLEGGLTLVDCCRQADDCRRSNACAAQRVWKELEALISDYLLSVSLQQMIDVQYEEQGVEPQE